MELNNSSWSLKNKNTLITGSTQGIGYSIALFLAQAGANIILHGLSKDELSREALKEIKKTGVAVNIVESDLSTEEGIEQFIHKIDQLSLEIDILVLNAAIQIRKPFFEITYHDFSQQVTANIWSHIRLIQRFSADMKVKQWGRIITIGSIQERQPHKDMAVYAASKAAVRNMVYNLSQQLAGDAITVNNIAPGVILTARNSEVLENEAYRQSVVSKIPLGRIGIPNDCAGIVLLICSELGNYITGETIYVSGGL